MALSFWKDQVTVLRAPLITKNGMEKRDWENAVPHIIKNVLVTAQATSREFGDRVTQVTDRRTLRANCDADIIPGDRVIWKEDTYEIDGEVFNTVSPTGRVSSTRCTLVRWEG